MEEGGEERTRHVDAEFECGIWTRKRWTTEREKSPDQRFLLLGVSISELRGGSKFRAEWGGAREDDEDKSRVGDVGD